MAQPRREALFHVDAGWLFLIAGIATIAATVLIPASSDLDEARLQRDWALAVEGHRLDRLERHAAYLEALERGQENLIVSLAAIQLNKVPAGRAEGIDHLLTDRAAGRLPSASIFPGLEPEPLRPLRRIEQTSLLGRLATGETSRLWLLAGGVVCVLIGVLPPAAGRA